MAGMCCMPRPVSALAKSFVKDAEQSPERAECQGYQTPEKKRKNANVARLFRPVYAPRIARLNSNGKTVQFED